MTETPRTQISPSSPGGRISPVRTERIQPSTVWKKRPTVVSRSSGGSSMAQLVMPAEASVCPREGRSVKSNVLQIS